MVETPTEMQQVESAVKRIEARTQGEIVPVLVECSDVYSGARWRFAILFALVVTYLASLGFHDPRFGFHYFFAAEIVLIVVGLLLTRINWLMQLLVDDATTQEEVQQRARQFFHDRGLHATRARTGILIFVSRLERRIEILADSGIHAHVGEAFWRQIVELMLPMVQQGKFSEAFLAALERCEEPLARHFPKQSDDVNELPDSVQTEV